MLVVNGLMALDVDRCSYEPYVIIPRQGKSYLEEGGEGNNEKDLMKRKSCYQETGAPCIPLYDDLMMVMVMMYIIFVIRDG